MRSTILQPIARLNVWLYLALAGITLLGLGIRLFGLTSYGVWFDEAYHVQLVRLPTVAAMLGAVLANPPSDPLYVLLLRPWVGLFGSGDGSIRGLSVLLSTATLPAAYALGRVLAGRAVGLLGAGLLALSPYVVELGQEAALYVLATLTTTLALAAAWRWRATGRGAGWYLLLGSVAIYSHYVVAAILALLAGLGWWAAAGPRRVTGRAWLGLHAAIGATWLPWLAALAVSWLASPLPRATLRHPATPSEVVGALVQFTSGSAVLLQGQRGLLAGGLLVGGLLAGAGLLGAGWLAGGASARRGLRILVILGALIFFPPALVSALTGRWLFVPHFMVFLLPAGLIVLAAGALWLLAARGFSGVPWDQGSGIRDQGSGISGTHSVIQNPKSKIQNLPTRTTGALLLLGWLVVQGGGLVWYNRFPPHGVDGLRELAAVLRQEAAPGDTVLVTPPVLDPTLRQYYPGPIHGLPSEFDLRQVYLPYDPATWNMDSLAALERTVGGGRFWLVYRPELDAGGTFLATVQRRWRLLRQAAYPYATLYLFAP